MMYLTARTEETGPKAPERQSRAFPETVKTIAREVIIGMLVMSLVHLVQLVAMLLGG
jgi:hypothetical protein